MSTPVSFQSPESRFIGRGINPANPNISGTHAPTKDLQYRPRVYPVSFSSRSSPVDEAAKRLRPRPPAFTPFYDSVGKITPENAARAASQVGNVRRNINTQDDELTMSPIELVVIWR